VKLLLKEGIRGRKIVPDDIGIISPYKAQIIRLKQTFEKLSEIEIGTTEYFQGREKNIIIISTVKSHAKIGFLNNEKVRVLLHCGTEFEPFLD
jgi:helicase MOV-10